MFVRLRQRPKFRPRFLGVLLAVKLLRLVYGIPVALSPSREVYETKKLVNRHLYKLPCQRSLIGLDRRVDSGFPFNNPSRLRLNARNDNDFFTDMSFFN